ncbi:MAG: DNA primase, partial [Sedimentisphaerales bacterium]|nr:DNA primase [Sedimentisphaerales bacterium]
IVLEVQQANDIVDVISEHVSLKKKGREMVGLCPFHDDHKPSMNVNSVKQIFKCFACGAGGDVFKFVQMRENLTFPQAIERLAERAGIKLKKLTTQSSKLKTIDADPNSLARVNAWAAKYFQKNLHGNKGKYALDYLAQRQISPESIKKWQLGLALDSQDDLTKAAASGKVPAKLLTQAGLTTGFNQDKFVNRLMFTITDVTGRVIGFGGRTLNENGAKYINSPSTVLFDKSNSLYGLEQARHEIVSSGTAIVVEGYTDCIMAHQFGCRNVVATLGTSLTTGHGRILRRYAKKVVLIFDSDVAGMEAANRALDVCLSQRIDIKIASVPEGKDPCDFLLTAGQEGFERLIGEAADIFQFKWDRLKEKFGSEDTLAGKKAAIEEYLETIATGLLAGHVSDIDCGLIVNQISKIIGLDNKQINAELNTRLKRAARTADRNASERRAQVTDYGQGRFAAAQREILEVLLNEPQLYDTVRQNITAELFDVPILRQIAEMLFEALRADNHAELRQILAGTESVQLSNCIMELAQAGEEKGNYRARLDGALGAIKRYEVQKQKKPFKTLEEKRQYLRRFGGNAGRENPHSLGMV